MYNNNDEKGQQNDATNQEEKVRAMFEVEELEDRLEMTAWSDDPSDGPDGPSIPTGDGPDQ